MPKPALSKHPGTRLHLDDNPTPAATATPSLKVWMPDKIEHVPIDCLKLSTRQLRNQPQRLIDQLVESYKSFGVLSVIVADREDIVRAGSARVAAAKKMGLPTVPVIRTGQLSKAKLRAFQLADNKLSELAKWNRPELALELEELSSALLLEGLSIDITGFETTELDDLVLDHETETVDPADIVPEPDPANARVSKPGDLYLLGKHRVLCADARQSDALNFLMDGNKADAGFFDPPYNLPVKDIGGRGSIQHDEFAMASGEQSFEEFRDFLKDSLGAAAAVSRPGALHYVCMGWQHLEELLTASRSVYGAQVNLAVWVKSNGGQGSFYRSQHEHVGVFRVGKAQHLNNVQLGRHGRSRTNVWPYAGANTFRPGRMADLRDHPTVKPLALVCDALRDCTKRNDIVLDTFCGSGTTVLAAEKIGRRAFAIEIEPRFVDVTIKRWQSFCGKDAVHAKTGQTFDQMAKGRTQKIRVRA